MELDLPRTRLLALIERDGTDLKKVSLAIGRNHAYLQQFVYRGTPRNLPEAARESLGKIFGVDPDYFRPPRSKLPVDPAPSQTLPPSEEGVPVDLEIGDAWALEQIRQLLADGDRKTALAMLDALGGKIRGELTLDEFRALKAHQP